MSGRRRSTVTVDIQRHSPGWTRYPRLSVLLRKAAKTTLSLAGKPLFPTPLLAIALADDAAVRVANRGWRAKDKPTNVLSFPAVTGPQIATAPYLGDVILALETVEREALEQEKTFSAHAAHLVIHGVLHLIGFDHLTVQEAEEMEAIERKAMLALGLPDPYLNTDVEETSAA